MSFFDGFIGGAATSMAGDIGQQMQNDSMLEKQKAMAQFNADLQEQKERTVMQLKQDMATAPLTRLSELAKQKLGEQVPVDASPVTTASGQDPRLADNTAGMTGNKPTSGMVGKYADLVAKAKDLPAEDQQPYLAQLNRQFGADQSASQNAVAGKTRSRTSDEAFNSALDDAKINDPVAYAAGLPLSAPKTISVADGATLIDPKTGKVVYQNNGKEDRAMEREDRRDDRLTQTQNSIAERQDKSIAAAINASNRKHDVQSEMTPDMDVTAKAIANGQIAPITGYGLRSPGAQAIMAKVLDINPDFSAKDFMTQGKAEKDFATGKQGNSVRSFNVSVEHLNTLSELANALDNRDTQLINKLGNLYATQTGGQAPTNFETAKHIVADEIIKAVTGSAGALGDRDSAAKTIDAANSPAQLRGSIETYQKLMIGQLDGLKHQYEATTGRKDFEDKYLMGSARDLYHSLKPAAKSVAQSSVGMPSDISGLLGKYGSK